MPLAATSLEGLLAKGSTAIRAVADEVKSRIARLSRRGLPPAEILRKVRLYIARHEPILSRVLSDTLLAAWVAGVHEIGQDMPSRDGGNRLPPPRRPIAASGDTDGPPPVVRYPAIEKAAHDLMTRNVVTREDFDRLSDDAKRAAFTVAKVSSLDAISKVEEAVRAGVTEGETLAKFSKRVGDAVGSSALSPAHAETVFRTNVMGAYSVGLMDILNDDLVSDEFPYLEYTAVHDARARKEHREMESLGIQGSSVYRRDDPIWELFLPPWHYNCRCAVIPLSIEDAARKGIKEAQAWLKAGIPPARPAWVKRPPFSPPPGWARNRIEALV